MVGPFNTRRLPSLRISPLGLIPKKTPGECRLIHHLSFPFGKSVNSHIPKIASSVHYASIDDAIMIDASLWGVQASVRFLKHSVQL